jgi:endonuclease/exonuclease/phosphatase (EEP) superfamily protein YafD
MSTLRNRLLSVEDRMTIQQHKDLLRQIQSHSQDEQLFFTVHGYWPENGGDELPQRVEFTARGITTIVTTQWADGDKKTRTPTP